MPKKSATESGSIDGYLPHRPVAQTTTHPGFPMSGP
jgi:hypothetical protein